MYEDIIRIRRGENSKKSESEGALHSYDFHYFLGGIQVINESVN